MMPFVVGGAEHLQKKVVLCISSLCSFHVSFSMGSHLLFFLCFHEFFSIFGQKSQGTGSDAFGCAAEAAGRLSSITFCVACIYCLNPFTTRPNIMHTSSSAKASSIDLTLMPTLFGGVCGPNKSFLTPSMGKLHKSYFQIQVGKGFLPGNPKMMNINGNSKDMVVDTTIEEGTLAHNSPKNIKKQHSRSQPKKPLGYGSIGACKQP